MQDWENLNKDFVNWAAKNKIKDYFIKNFLYKDFSIWWILNIYQKDNVINNQWYFKLRSLLHYNINIKFNYFTFLLIFIIKFTKNFFYNIFFLLFIKSQFKKKCIEKKKNCFFGAEINFKNSDYSYNTLYGLTPIKKNIKDNFYLIKIIKKYSFIANVIKYKKIFNKLNLEYIILDRYISINEVIKIYFFSLKVFFKAFIFFKKNKSFFYIKNKNCFNILFPHVLNSLSGSVQESLISSTCLYNFTQKNKKIKNFINYLEFSPEGVFSTYFFLKKSSPSTKIITIQHSYASNNLLFYNHKDSDFTNKADEEGKKYAPSPDVYLIFSQGLKKILNKFYKKKVKFIGALREDTLSQTYTKKINIKKNGKKIILVCPSIGDSKTIANYLQLIDKDKYMIIISPHPVGRSKTINEFKYLTKNKIKFSSFDNYSSKDLLKISDLVICGFSSVAIYASIKSIPVIRVKHFKYPHFFDTNDKIRNISNDKEFIEFMLNFPKKVKPNKKKSTYYEKYFFYKLDNKSYLRFWKELK